MLKFEIIKKGSHYYIEVTYRINPLAIVPNTKPLCWDCETPVGGGKKYVFDEDGVEDCTLSRDEALKVIDAYVKGLVTIKYSEEL